jgi:hypothetical protein
MTTFESQPQSRRAVRQSERADDIDTQNGYVDSGDMWDTISRRAAQLPPVSTLSAEPQLGRRSATPVSEPLTYSTQTRPTAPAPAPAPQGPTFRSRGSVSPQPVPFDTSTPQAEQPAYRVRDFSPAASGTPSQWSAPSQTPAQDAPATDLDYRTEARFRAAAAAAPLAPISEIPAAVAPINKMWAAPASVEPTVVVPSTSDFPIEQTLTRRELRALQQAEEAAALQSQQPSAPAQRSAVVQPQATAPAQPSVVQTQPPAASPLFPLVEPRQGPPPAMPPMPSPIFTPSAPPARVSSSPFDLLLSAPAEPMRPEPVAQIPAEIAPAPVVDGASTWTPPRGHWSTQIDDDDIETTFSRRIGSGSTTTSALVLPSIPGGADIRGPLTSTGEIMLTGSIELPRSLASTGQSDRFDNGGIDELFDLNDSEVISTDSSPVRAIRAVSTHTSGHGVTHTHKPKGTRALTALLIAASSMAVVVAGLLVAAFAFNVF